MWGANHEADLAGYRVFVREDGRSFDYGFPEWEGSETGCTIQDLDEDTHYYFVVRAFDTAGNESGDSNQIGLPIMLLSPQEGVKTGGAPTFHWTPGPCNLYLFCTLFCYPGVGYYPAYFWVADNSFVMPDSWWDKVEAGHLCYWDVHGFNLDTGYYESPDYDEFTKVQ